MSTPKQNHTVKTVVKKVPVIGPLSRKGLHGLRSYMQIPRIEHQLGELQENLESLSNHIRFLEKNIGQHQGEVQETLGEIKNTVANINGRYSDLQHQVAVVEREQKKGGTKAGPATPTTVARMADDHSLDQFYLEFENRYRGTEEEIHKRQLTYIPYLKKMKVKGTDRILDIGCGRGEFLAIAKDNGFTPVGLDLNEKMVEGAKKKGYETYQEDALTYLLKQKSGSIAAVTGFHIVEHISFDELIHILNECYRVLAPGGLIVFETPNPENLTVGAHTFYYDPSHLHPLPPELLRFAVETRGFTDIEVLRLHAVEDKLKTTKLPADVAQLVYGPRDYSVIAAK